MSAPPLVFVVRMPRNRAAIGGVSEGHLTAWHLGEFRTLCARIDALGGSVLAWGGTFLAFSVDEALADDAAEFVASECRALHGSAPRFAAGVAQGDVEPLRRAEGGVALAGGGGVERALQLARAARGGELRVDDPLAVRVQGAWNFLVAVGAKRECRLGASIDTALPLASSQPLPRVRELCEPPFVGRDRLAALFAHGGRASVVAAEAGFGGSRLLAELRRALAPAPCLMVEPVGLGREPLGALRSAFASLVAHRPPRLPPEFAIALERLLSGAGVDLGTMAELVVAALRTGAGALARGAVLIDDAFDVDEESLQACAAAVARTDEPFLLVVRTDASAELPPPLAGVARGHTLHLSHLTPPDARHLLDGALGAPLAPAAATQLSRRAARVPLSLVEALAELGSEGELVVVEGGILMRSQSGLRGRAMDPTEWARQRVAHLGEGPRDILAAVAFLGQHASRPMLQLFLGALRIEGDVGATLSFLSAQGFFAQSDDERIALRSKTHRRAALSLIDPETADHWHGIAAEVIARGPPSLAFADAAQHALRGKLLPRARELFTAASEVARTAGLYEAASRLAESARRHGAGTAARVDDGDITATLTPIFRQAVHAATASRGAGAGSGATTEEHGDDTPSGASPFHGGGVQAVETAAKRVTEAEALPLLAKLRRQRDGLKGAPLAEQCRASVVLSMELLARGFEDEALVWGLDGLARAREDADERAASACLALLAKVFYRAGRSEEARRVELALRAPTLPLPRPPPDTT